MSSLTIGQTAKKTGVAVATIRFYERIGLIESPPRKKAVHHAGYRQFPPETIDRIRFIQRAKDLGFSLKEISELLELRLDPQAECLEVKEKARAKIEHIERKIKTLQRMKRALKKLTLACDGEALASECPILESLEKQ